MAGTPNQNPEQIARDAIDVQLAAAGWTVQSKSDWGLTNFPNVVASLGKQARRHA